LYRGTDVQEKYNYECMQEKYRGSGAKGSTGVVQPYSCSGIIHGYNGITGYRTNRIAQKYRST